MILVSGGVPAAYGTYQTSLTFAISYKDFVSQPKYSRPPFCVVHVCKITLG